MFVFLAFFTIFFVPCNKPQYVVEDLGLFPASQSSRAFCVNDERVVVGECTENFLIQKPCAWKFDGVEWRVSIFACCDVGVAVARAQNGYTVSECGSSGVFQNGDVCETVSGLGGTFSAPYDVNTKGVVVGYSLTPENEGHAFLWKGGKAIDLFPDSDFSVATSVNDSGNVTGFFQGENFETVAFVRADNGAVVLLPALGGAHATTSSLSNTGIVAGAARTRDGVLHACVWRRAYPNGEMIVTDIGALHFADTTSEAYAVNDAGVVIGAVASGADMRPFVWTRECGAYDIEACIVAVKRGLHTSNTPFRLIRVSSINNQGDIVGWGMFVGDDAERAVFLRNID